MFVWLVNPKKLIQRERMDYALIIRSIFRKVSFQIFTLLLLLRVFYKYSILKYEENDRDLNFVRYQYYFGSVSVITRFEPDSAFRGRDAWTRGRRGGRTSSSPTCCRNKGKSDQKLWNAEKQKKIKLI